MTIHNAIDLRGASLRACDFFDLFVFFAPDQMLFSPLQKGVILPAPACRGSEAPRRSIASQRVYGAESKDPGDARSQVLFGAFRPQTTRGIEKAIDSERSRPVPPAPACRGACRGGICSSADPSWRCFSTKRSLACGPTQGDEKRLGPATTLHGTIALSFVIPGGCDFFNFPDSLWPESSEEHLPASIAGVLRLRAINPLLCDRSAGRFAQDDAFPEGTKQHLVGWGSADATSALLKVGGA